MFSRQHPSYQIPAVPPTYCPPICPTLKPDIFPLCSVQCACRVLCRSKQYTKYFCSHQIFLTPPLYFQGSTCASRRTLTASRPPTLCSCGSPSSTTSRRSRPSPRPSRRVSRYIYNIYTISTHIYTISTGKPFTLPCEAPDGWPKPSVYWMIQVIFTKQ